MDGKHGKNMNRWEKTEEKKAEFNYIVNQTFSMFIIFIQIVCFFAVGLFTLFIKRKLFSNHPLIYCCIYSTVSKSSTLDNFAGNATLIDIMYCKKCPVETNEYFNNYYPEVECYKRA